MDRFWVIGDSKRYFFEKSPFLFFFIKLLFLHTFCQKRTFCYPTTFIESLITHKRFIFEESYISYGKRQKSCTYWRLRFLIRRQSWTVLFICQWGSTFYWYLNTTYKFSYSVLYIERDSSILWVHWTFIVPIDPVF